MGEFLPPAQAISSFRTMSRQSLLDRPAARGLALLVFFLALTALGYVHREDLFPPPEAAVSAADDPFRLCFDQRRADIQQMLKDGVIEAGQAALFEGRAEALCRSQAGGQGPPPPPQ